MLKIKSIHISVSAETDQEERAFCPRGISLTSKFQDELRWAVRRAIAKETCEDISYPDELDEGPETHGVPNLYHFLVG
jgi:hypothetical protein